MRGLVTFPWPALACETFLTSIKGDTLTLRPLRKFPVIHDLTVDRTGIMENLKKANVYIGEYHQSRPKEHRHQYDVAKCLKCGLCLEVCPANLPTLASMARMNRMRKHKNT